MPPLPDADALGANFHMALLSELSKVSQFYSVKVSQLEVRAAGMTDWVKQQRGPLQKFTVCLCQLS